MLFSDFTRLRKLLKPVKAYNLARFRPITGFSFDSRSIRRGQAFIAVKGRHKDGHDFINPAMSKGAALVVAQNCVPSAPVPFFIVKDTSAALAAVASYIRKRSKTFVYGVTGSVGKTTTKDMLSFLLSPAGAVLKNKETQNNFFGVSKTILSLDDEKIMVLELGTNSKGEIRHLSRISRPDIGIITFIKPAHLAGLGSLKGVLQEKLSLLRAVPKIKAVLNGDDPYLAKVPRRSNIYWFGRSKRNNLYARLLTRRAGRCVFVIQGKYKLSLPYYLEGFITNMLAAILGAHLYGLSLRDLVERSGAFGDFGPRRMEMKEIGGFSVLNDAYNANPYSFRAAFRVLGRSSLPKVAVVGDMLELGKRSAYYHRQLAPQIIKSDFACCLAVGEHTVCLVDKLKDLGYRRAYHFSCLRDIARFIKARVPPRSLIFLKGSRKMELEKVLEYI